MYLVVIPEAKVPWNPTRPYLKPFYKSHVGSSFTKEPLTNTSKKFLRKFRIYVALYVVIIFLPRPNKSADPPEVLLLLFVLAISNVALADDPDLL